MSSDNDALRSRIVTACEIVIARGFRISHGGYNVCRGADGTYAVDVGGWCCPLGAVLVAEHVKVAHAILLPQRDLAPVLSVERAWLRGFVDGVDLRPTPHERTDQEEAGYALGREIIARYQGDRNAPQ